MVQVHDMLALEDDMVQVHGMKVLEDDMVQVHGMKVLGGEGMKAAELQTEYGASQGHEVACNWDPSGVVYSLSPWPCCDDDDRDGGHHEEGVCSQSPWPCCDDGGGLCPEVLDVFPDGERAGHSPASGAPA